MDTQKRMYETTFIVNASLDDAQIDTVIGRVQDTITKNGGVISALNKWGRKRLAYPISKKTNGFYVNIEFSAAATLLALLERSYQLDEMILRYLTIVLDRKALTARRNALAAVSAVAEATPEIAVREPLFKETEEKK